MEWVEVTGRTVEAAKEAALDQLGVDEADAEFEILEEPKAGLFGRLRSEARVRARVAPSSPRPKVERRDRKKGRRPRSGGGSGEGSSGGGESRGGGGSRGGGRGGGGQRAGVAVSSNQDEDLEGDVADDAGADDRYGDDDLDEDEVEVAESFLTGLLETYGTPFTVERRELEDDLVELSVKGEDLGLLIGPRGQTLAAVQELTRTVVQRRSRGRSSRIVLDIAGYRQARRVALARFASEVADQVRSSGVARVLEPMPPADRKVVHDAINAIDGVTTNSEGEEPRRRVVISPQGGTA
ncbi:MAG: RNA-binding cell elongation regulator Jag/EloR [Acidimicrobiales bacterium]